jgi:DNA-binding CsgD family transcriptional regulator
VIADPGAGLTAQEAVVARLVADGRSNKEVAAELFLSVKTVEVPTRAGERADSRRRTCRLAAAHVPTRGAPEGRAVRPAG